MTFLEFVAEKLMGPPVSRSYGRSTCAAPSMTITTRRFVPYLQSRATKTGSSALPAEHGATNMTCSNCSTRMKTTVPDSTVFNTGTQSTSKSTAPSRSLYLIGDRGVSSEQNCCGPCSGQDGLTMTICWRWSLS